MTDNKKYRIQLEGQYKALEEHLQKLAKEREKPYQVTMEQMREGWENSRRVHGCVVHAEIRNDKIWIHYDGIEDGITDELVAAGVPKDHIVLAFHPPQVREHTGYALA